MAASMPTGEASGYIDYFEAARLLNVTVERIRALVTARKLASTRMPGTNRRYLERAAVIAYRDARDARTNLAQPVMIPDQITELRERIAAASGPTYEAGAEWLRNLANIAVAGIMSMPGGAGVVADPKAASSSPASYMVSCLEAWAKQSGNYSPSR